MAIDAKQNKQINKHVEKNLVPKIGFSSFLYSFLYGKTRTMSLVKNWWPGKHYCGENLIELKVNEACLHVTSLFSTPTEVEWQNTECHNVSTLVTASKIKKTLCVGE